MEGVSATGDIWSTGAFSFESPLKDLLDRGDYTLEELLAEDELLQELRGMHPQLIDFFSSEKAVVGLLKYVTRMEQEEQETTTLMNGNGSTLPQPQPEQEPQEEETESLEEGEEKKPGQWLFPPMENPSGSTEEKSPEEQEELLTIRYPYMACEVICCEINSIIDILVDGSVTTNEPVKGQVEEEDETAVEVTAKDPHSPRILDLLFSLLYETPIGELDDYRAGYFDKILSVLFRKRPKAMSAYINEGGIALMTAMMNHLYSNSIMQIVQKLLMPPPSSFLQGDAENQDYDEDDEDVDSNSLFQCQWSEVPESIDLLLDSLIGTSNGQDEDLQLSKSQSASEVLITVIQNSPLTSATLLALTEEPVMGRIARAASTLEDGAEFSPHDSSLTCAMNVLESLVLQLGGYGSVGTALETSTEEGGSTEAKIEEEPVVNGDDASIELEVNKILKSAQEVATPDALITHLPDLLLKLCGLLRHASTETWQSPMQFAKNEKQALLGMSRLRIVRLIESLVLLGNPKVDALLCESDCLSICLDLFWEFQWCSMLHQSVANLLVHVFEGANERVALQEYFIVKCNLLGRLMGSFEDPDTKEETDEGDLLSHAVMAIQRLHLKTRSTSIQSERGSSIGSIEATFGDNDDDEVIAVSDDDVDAVLEQQAVSELEEPEKESEHEDNGTDSTEHESNVGGDTESSEEHANEAAEVKSIIPSLRMGCLGHVIIICQALVHACTADMNESHEDANEPHEDATESTLMRSVDLGESEPPVPSRGDRTSETDITEDNEKGESAVSDTSNDADPVGGQDADDEGQDTQDEPPDCQDEPPAVAKGESSDSQGSMSNDLVIAQLVKAHPLHDEWNDFVTSTLAAETAIQSTPLGGTNVATVESMQSQLPVARSGRSYDFNGDDVDESADIVARGFLGGEVLDMDDNDLDIAASMMEALNLSRPRAPDESDDGNLDNESEDRQEVVSNSFGTVVQNSGASSGDYLFDDPLGGGNARFGAFGAQDDDSSDEEEEVPGERAEDIADTTSAAPGVDEGDDAPVMDLFTGNFDEKGTTPENGMFSNFANFDDAFAAASTAETPIFSSGSSDEDDVLKTPPFETPEMVEDLFGTSPPHSLLLGDEDADNDRQAAEIRLEGRREDANKADTGMNGISSAPAEAPAETVSALTEESATEMVGTEPKLETANAG